MDLYSGTPYWMVKNPLSNYFNPLTGPDKTRVAIIGSGITGALVAHQLCRAGVECCMVDKRSVSTGSSCASTALLQYEIDVPLCRMVKMMPEQDAVAAYRACLDSIDMLGKILRQARVNAGFMRVPSVFYASNHRGLRLIIEEYRLRKKHGLPVELLDRKELCHKMGIEAPGALMNHVSGEVDAYEAAKGLIRHNLKKGLRLFTHTEIVNWKRTGTGYILTSREGNTIECDYVVIAAGFEAGPFLPENLMQLTSTFVIISQPVPEEKLWPQRSLIWETRDPYLYIRTEGQRIIVGGEDIPYNSRAARKFLLDKKAAVLEKKFRELYPDIPFKTELAWAGTFSSTKDGLPLIGSTKDNPCMLYALGYGGNGITFSVIAAEMLAGKICGKEDPRSHVFALNRRSLK